MYALAWTLTRTEEHPVRFYQWKNLPVTFPPLKLNFPVSSGKKKSLVSFLPFFSLFKMSFFCPFLPTLVLFFRSLSESCQISRCLKNSKLHAGPLSLSAFLTRSPPSSFLPLSQTHEPRICRNRWITKAIVRLQPSSIRQISDRILRWRADIPAVWSAA